MKNVYIALGTNIGNREENIKNALDCLVGFVNIVRQSSVYDTKPVGYKDQGNFLNMVVEVETRLTPTDLLTSLKKIEKKMGRVKTIRNGPRIIDLDILLFGNERVLTDVLEIPHKRMYERSFVLDPLSEIVDPLLLFAMLPRTAKQVCFLPSKNARSVLAWDSVDTFSSGDDLRGFLHFARTHKDKKLIGFLGYDLARKLHSVEQTATDDINLPNIVFYAFDKWLELPAYDSENLNIETQHADLEFEPEITRDAYTENFNKIQEYIKNGDIYQVNLTHRLRCSTEAHSRELFLQILLNNTVESPIYMEGNDFEILSFSPEKFVTIENTLIKTSPIKGTCIRGENKQTDEKNKQLLLENEKEKAELAMITDLLRNDIGKISKIGSVRLVEERGLCRTPSVWHTYSTITGELLVPQIEALISMLPAGSVTGCPKKRAIEIIDELEGKARGIYTGVIGTIEPGGEELDFNVVIRSIIKKGNDLYLQVGGGIVADSKEADEYQETADKASSFITCSAIAGVFETLRVYKGGKFFKEREHIRRLQSGADKIGLHIKYSEDEIVDMIYSTARKSEHEEQKLNIEVIAGKFTIKSEKLELDRKIYNGVQCKSIECVRTMPEVKSLPFLQSHTSHSKARASGCFEAILKDRSGEIYEGAYSNVFWFKDGVLYTRESGVLLGITRATILDISPFETKFETININDLYKADEVFLTSSLKEIVPVVKIDEYKIGSGKVGVKTNELMKLFNSVVLG